MPEFHSAPQPATAASDEATEEIRFPPVSRDHILYCSYDYWFPKYRKVCIKSRIIPLPAEFIEYLREDSIILSDESHGAPKGKDEDDDDDWEPSNPTMRHYKSADEEKYDVFLDADDSDDDDDNAPPVVRLPPNKRFPELHQRIKDEIAALGGVVAPKLNWSAPKDAAELMEQKNTMKCRTPDDIYFMLKSSNFVSHDLEHAFDGTTPTTSGPSRSASASASTPTSSSALGFHPVLVLRAYFDIHTALEFRCFVKQRNLVAVTPRDLKYYPYLEGLRSTILERTKTLFHSKLQFTFPSGNFVFDIYIPEKRGHDVGDVGDNEADAPNPNGRLSYARLIDINPWAPRTDTLLFDWKELLELKIPTPFLGIVGDSGVADEDQDGDQGDGVDGEAADDETEDDSGVDDDDDDNDDDYNTELRLVDEDDPAAMNFSSAPYSAHKLPKEVVDASMAGEGGLREFAQQWQEIVQSREQRR
ncbi:hypothetical protein HMPREF1624_06105 [Sporothrix schenckii ATCC 58251]|uniref:Uncharacterized protein n=1 Tax=Sporothrix schenckii (strain ATCC 58251 / de Perez 2211183) TaxID=1391915 RepID=U7PT96_SPOS1|nr:hypothetical protein HMPREF1624_06105 [Sporothrix schenckii ATCC 58251]